MLTVRYARGLCGLLSPSTLLRRQGLPSTTNRLTSPPVTASITATTHLCNPPARAPFSNTAPALKKKKKVYLPVPESFLKYVKAPQNHLGTRIDRLCLRYFNVKTAKAQLMIKVGHIKVFRSSTPDDPSTYEHMKHATHRTALAANMILQVPKNFLEDPFGIHAVSKPRRHTLIDTSSVDHIIPIMYASQGLLVLNKPQGLASQGKFPNDLTCV
ncbi:hypothetical protein IWQ60_010436 [Tieghemiomyces parasiticus]|uniref:Uncharacterized protein n=1 Tax=Tieghemiomyces parasiticus TaxID=78921 RepID=A0A9W7ZQF5_9FUNG|nr:hypothetical protein IWQ60_010436 [Tieghemiomyces parasiticus]